VRDDLARPLLEAHEIATTEAAPMVTAPAVFRASRRSFGTSVTVAGQTSLAPDGSLWMGAGPGSLCARRVVLRRSRDPSCGRHGRHREHRARYNCDPRGLGAQAGQKPSSNKVVTRLGAEALSPEICPCASEPEPLARGLVSGAGWLSTSAVLGTHGARTRRRLDRARRPGSFSPGPAGLGSGGGRGPVGRHLAAGPSDPLHRGWIRLAGEPLGASAHNSSACAMGPLSRDKRFHPRRSRHNAVSTPTWSEEVWGTGTKDQCYDCATPP